MTQQDKDLLLRDLSAKLPHGVKVSRFSKILKLISVRPSYRYCLECELEEGVNMSYEIDEIKPYLRPISSLTQEERDKFCDIGGVISHRPDGKLYLVAYFPEALDYLNSIHADYRGMIEKGLAIEVTDENNPYK